MAVSIKFDQTGKPAGVAGQAREDLDAGLAVTAQAIGGPFSAYLWTFIYKAIDPDVSVEATSAFTASTAASTDIDPVDQPGTYLIRVTVDSGSGLGATADDVAELTFYAGVPADPLEGAPNADPSELPRRFMAFREQVQHNVPDAIDAGGNRQGWAREWLRIKALIKRLYLGKVWASGRVHMVAGPNVSLVRGFNVSGVAYGSAGVHNIQFIRPMPDTSYGVLITPFDSSLVCAGFNLATTDFDTFNVAPATGVPTDGDYCFAVILGVGE